MTIARTGNLIVDGIARARVKAQAEERRIVAAAKKSARKGKGGGKFRGAGKAGRAAARRPAKGIAAKRLSLKASGAKTASYGLKGGAELISSNCGYDIPTIAAGLSQKMRSEIENQIERMTFSTPASSGRATIEEWRARVDFIRQELGIDDSFSYCASRHTDAEHDHIHLDFNRVNDQGKLWKDNQIGLRLAAIEEKIEQKFSLKLTRREDFLTHGNLSKTEIERATREGVQPVFLQVQSAIRETSRDKPDVLLFISRLADQGIAARPNLRQNELNGFSYSLSGQSFTGKQVGANWAQLKTELSYVESEHAQALAALKKLIDAGATRPARQPARADERGVERTEGSTRPSPERVQEIEGPARGLGQPMEQPGRQVEQATSQAKAKAAQELHEPSLGHPSIDDPIAKKMRTRQAVIDRLRKETGDRHELAQELATRLERADLYRQREIVKGFIADHKADPKAMAIVKAHLPELVPVPAAPMIRPSEPVSELPERLRIAERYQEPTPQNPADHLPGPSM